MYTGSDQLGACARCPNLGSCDSCELGFVVAPLALSVAKSTVAKLLGKKTRSACEVVTPPDPVPPWAISERVHDWASAFNRDPNVPSGYTDDDWSAAHVNAFVPLCREMEGDKFTADGHRSGAGLALKERARVEFQQRLRDGRLRIGAPLPAQPAAVKATILPATINMQELLRQVAQRASQEPAAPVVSQPTASTPLQPSAAPSAAGFAGGGSSALLLAGAALFLLMSMKRGR